jgi:two-component system chemotaxis sensor kinase CheA
MGKTVRVDIDRLDNLMNLVSELIIIKTRLEGVGTDSKNQDMTEAVEYLERITTSLHDAVMKVRMVPIERVFNRFPRMVRDLSKDLSKEINLNMSGEETELDRTVIDEIGDPLIHLIRNSIDHGIEERDERIKNNKTAEGTVNLRAYQDGNSVVIEVEDDGTGIDVEKVKKKAIERGIVSQSDANELDENNTIDLLFRPGFSTADKVSDLSGRLVGLYVFKTKIESLNGLVEVENSRGKGSKFIIRLPLTLAIIQALLVTIGEEKYAIPLNVIRDINTIKSSLIRNVHGQDVVLNRDNVLPIVRLGRMLDVDNDISTESEELTAVIVKKGDKNAALIIDGLIGQQEIVIKTLGKFLSGIKNIAGATILGDGQVALIVDTNSLI